MEEEGNGRGGGGRRLMREVRWIEIELDILVRGVRYFSTKGGGGRLMRQARWILSRYLSAWS